MLLSQLPAPSLGSVFPQWDAEWGMWDVGVAIPKGSGEDVVP